VTSGTKHDEAAPNPDRPKKTGAKPIRLVDLIPRGDVKGGARTVFGASKVPSKDHRKKPPAK
jgi:hypothetical protein